MDQIVVDRGDVEAGFASAEHIASGRYDSPYQMHATFGPNCAIADVKADSALLICSSQNIYESRMAVASVHRSAPRASHRSVLSNRLALTAVALTTDVRRPP